MSLNIITDGGRTKSYRNHQDQFCEDARNNSPLDHTVSNDIKKLIDTYWGKMNPRPAFYRTREELESLAGLGEYNKVTHRYENGDTNVMGIEITFEHLGAISQTYPRLRSFTVWDALNPDAVDFPAMRLNEARIVVKKETVATLVRHIDPVLAWNFNPHRAFLLEITVGCEKTEKGATAYYAILRHIHHFIADFLCAESDNPVPIPPRKTDE